MIKPYLTGILVAAVAAMQLLTIWTAYEHGKSVEASRNALAAEAMRANFAEALAAEQQKTRENEQAANQRQADISKQYTKELSDAKARTDKTISDLRTGIVRLRDDLASAECVIQGVSGIATGTGRGDGACTGGLRPEDAEFLVLFADSADARVRQLQACQRTVASDRQLCGVEASR